MHIENADDLVAFHGVRIIRSTAPALFCAIASKRVWLPREHIKGKLWNRGDSGTLMVRRWIAADRHLTVPNITGGLPIVVDVPEHRDHPLRALALVPREVPRGH